MIKFPSNSLNSFRGNLLKMLSAIYAIQNSDMFVNIISKKLGDEVLQEKKLRKAAQEVIRKYPDKYVQNLFLINIVSLLEVYLKDRLLEAFNNDESFIILFLKKYDPTRKISIEDVIGGPLKLANSLVDEITFHNLPKIERLYNNTFTIDIKKMADFKLLNLSIKLRHAFVHEVGIIKGKEIQINSNYLETIINEIAKFVENIDFYIVNKRVKKNTVNYCRKNRSQQNLFDIQDQINYESEKFLGF